MRLSGRDSTSLGGGFECRIPITALKWRRNTLHRPWAEPEFRVSVLAWYVYTSGGKSVVDQVSCPSGVLSCFISVQISKTEYCTLKVVMSQVRQVNIIYLPSTVGAGFRRLGSYRNWDTEWWAGVAISQPGVWSTYDNCEVVVGQDVLIQLNTLWLHYVTTVKWWSEGG